MKLKRVKIDIMKDKVKQFIDKNKETIFAICFTILYAIITGIIAIHHENWRDENQVWLLCKDLSFIDLLKQLKYEGHPFVWFAIVYPFAKLGISCKIVNILSWIVMVISVYLILKKAPFGKIARLCIILTFPMMYQYVIVGRNYSLIVLFMTLICALNKKRKQHPVLYGVILALLANTHVIMAGFVAMITITFYIYELIINKKNNTKEENIKLFEGFVIVAVGGILLIIQLLQGLTVSSGTQKELSVINLLKNALVYFLGFPKSLYVYTYGEYIITIIFIIFIAVGIVRYRKETSIVIVSALFQALIYSLLGIMKKYMAVSLFFILMYAMWSIADRKEVFKGKKEIKSHFIIILMFEIMLLIIALLSMPTVIDMYIYDYKYNYSSAKEIGTYIYENLDDKIFITATDAECSAIIPYTSKAKFWNINTQNYYTYITWNSEREKYVVESDIENIIKNNFQYDKDIYYITCSSIRDTVKDYLEANGKLQEIYTTENSFIEENYIIYKIEIEKEIL